jgi:uncharacterized protein YqhQ
LVIVLSIAIFVPLGAFGLPFGWKIVSRILLVPVLAGLSYELIRLAARHEDHPLVQAILAPALLMQRLTTNPPDDDMLEVAIAAMKRVLELDAQAPAGAEV